MDLEEIAEALASGDGGPEVADILLLRCPSGTFVGEVINSRFLVAPCRSKRCRIVGAEHTDHVYDLVTGQVRTIPDAERHTGMRGRLAPKE